MRGMKAYAFKQLYRLRKKGEFQTVYKTGQRIRGDQFQLILVPNSQQDSRLGISVHGCRGAVKRNRIKRIIREFFRLYRGRLPQSIDLVFAVRKDFSLNSPQEIAQRVLPLLVKAEVFDIA